MILIETETFNILDKEEKAKALAFLCNIYQITDDDLECAREELIEEGIADLKKAYTKDEIISKLHNI